MNPEIIIIAVVLAGLAIGIKAENENGLYAVEHRTEQSFGDSAGAVAFAPVENDGTELSHGRFKRTLFLKKKILGAGLLGFGLGAIKGYKAGYRSAPEVHHVYVAPPPVRYVEYVDKPVYVEKIVERPVFHAAPEYEAPRWSPSDSSSSHGASSSSSSSNGGGYW